MRLEKINRYYGAWGIVLQILIYILITIYPNYLLFSYSASGVMTFNKELFVALKMLDFVSQNKGWINPILIGSIFYVPVVGFILNGKLTKKIELNENKVIRELICAFDSIVGSKKKRFNKCLQEINPERNLGEVFKEITKPIQQITVISENLKKVFENICDDKTMKVSVVLCESGSMNRYIYMSDDEASITIDELNQKSVAKESFKAKQMKIYRKGSKKTFNYVEKNPKITGVISFPIICGKSVYLMINITSKSLHPFKHSDQIFEYALDNFSCRYLLESYLLKIRKELGHEE